MNNHGSVVMGVFFTLLIVAMLWAFASRIKDDGEALPGARDIVVIDNCQYLTFRTYMGYAGITHKGDCSNRIHNRAIASP